MSIILLINQNEQLNPGILQLMLPMVILILIKTSNTSRKTSDPCNRGERCTPKSATLKMLGRILCWGWSPASLSKTVSVLVAIIRYSLVCKAAWKPIIADGD